METNKKNKKIKWVNFLHLYQPPSINEDTIRAVQRNSYSFIVKILKENKKAKITVNINASLMEHLEEFGYSDLIKDINKLALRGKIELVLSAAYHPVLALIPIEEAKRQIKKSLETSKKYFPKVNIKGFFFPEMVYDKRVAKYLKTIGIKWIILDELSYKGKFNQVDYSKKYIDKNSGLQIVFRNRNYSKDYPPKIILELLKEKYLQEVVLSGTDAELYGDRHVDYTGDFYYAVNNKKVDCQTVGDFLSGLKQKEVINPKIASWDTSEKELKGGEALYLWKNPKNKIHIKLWELTNLSLKLVKRNKRDKGYSWARYRLDRGLSSCVYWWASEKNFDLWDGPSWHPDQVISGAEDLIKSIRSLGSISIKDKLKAEKMYLKIEELVWKKHWSKYYSPLKK
jgi:predicted glycosyl hydrolase (DUF1957 family)